MFYIILIDI